MALALWTLDIGNSRAKLRSWTAARAPDGRVELERTARAETVPDSIPLAALVATVDVALFARAPSDERLLVALSCVASATLQDELVGCLAHYAGIDVLSNPESGLVNDAQPPESVGRDRLYAARGALEQLRTSAIVVDVGSAMTVDLLLVEQRDGRTRARFAGGAIAPGPALLARALHDHTARLPLVEVRPGAAALGRSTVSAIESGLLHGLRGAAFELVARMALAAGDARPELVITGGAAGLLLEPELFRGRAPIHAPDLVHIGLAHAALDAHAGATRQRGGV